MSDALTRSVFADSLMGTTGGIRTGLAGRIISIPGSGDGATLWVGGELMVPGVPPGTKGLLVDWRKTIYAEAIFGFEGRAQFFRPPYCDFPVGYVHGLQLHLSRGCVTGPVRFPCRAMPAHDNNGPRAFPLFTNSQNWTSKHYKSGLTNNVLFADPLSPDTLMQCTRINKPYPQILPPARNARPISSRL